MPAEPLRLEGGEVRLLRLPLRLTVRHASHTRTHGESLLVALDFGGGVRGWGEATPRPYVGGETLASAADDLTRDLVPVLRELRFTADEPPRVTLRALYEAQAAKRRLAAFTAIDLAVHDAWSQRFRVPGRALLGASEPARDAPVAAVVPLLSRSATIAALLAYRGLGFRDAKLKVAAGQLDAALRGHATLRRWLGADATLTLDANRTLDAAEATALCRALAHDAPAWLEDPLRDASPSALAALERATGVPVMVDETLLTTADGEALVAAGVKGPWNLRLGKCGGLTGVAALVALAHAHGRAYQLGAHVGETTLTANATRAALALGAPLRVDSSFGAWLLAGDPFAHAAESRLPSPRLAPLGDALGLAGTPNRARVVAATTSIRAL